MRTQHLVTLPDRKWFGSAPLSKCSTMDEERAPVSAVLEHGTRLQTSSQTSNVDANQQCYHIWGFNR